MEPYDRSCHCVGSNLPRVFEFRRHTVAAILEADTRGECHRCGRALPAPAPVPGKLIEWRHLDEAGRHVVDHIGQPKDWMRRFAGPCFRVQIAG